MTITEYRANAMFDNLLQDAYSRTDNWFYGHPDTECSDVSYQFHYRLALCENSLISDAVADIIIAFYKRNHSDE